MSKLPALQFYPGDWKKDPGVQALSRHDRSVWFDMILLMHESQEYGVLTLNGKPYPKEALARQLLLDNQNFETCLTTLLDFGVCSVRSSDGAIFCRRMVRDAEIRAVRKSAGLQGGNPVLLNQKIETSLTSTLSVPVYVIEDENEVESNIKKGGKGENKTEVTPFVWLTEKEITKFQENGTEFYKRLCEKLSAWIDQDQTPKRLKNGRNAGATFRSWVINAVWAEQKTSVNGGHQRKSNSEETVDTVKFFMEKANETGRNGPDTRESILVLPNPKTN